MVFLSSSNSDWSLVSTTIKDLSKSKIVDIGRKFTSPYLLIRVSSRGQKETWSYGGKLWVTSLVLGKQAKYQQIELEIFEQELISVSPYFEGKYSLLYQAPKWFPDVTIKVWEYRGLIDSNKPDYTEIANNLDNLNLVIANVNSSINTLSESAQSQNDEIKQSINDILLKANLQISQLSTNLSKVLSGESNYDILNTETNINSFDDNFLL